MADKPTPAERKRRYEEARQKALDAFPYTRIEVPGDQVLATWVSLGASGRDAPVVVGQEDALRRVVEAATEWPGIAKRSTEEILEIAGRLRHPDDLTAKSAKDMASAREQFTQLLRNKPETPIPDFLQSVMGDAAQAISRDEAIAAMLNDSSLRVGEWPTTAPGSPGLSVANDLHGNPLPVTHVIIIPTEDWTTIPAYLNWALERLPGARVSRRRPSVRARPVWSGAGGIEPRRHEPSGHEEPCNALRGGRLGARALCLLPRCHRPRRGNVR